MRNDTRYSHQATPIFQNNGSNNIQTSAVKDSGILEMEEACDLTESSSSSSSSFSIIEQPHKRSCLTHPAESTRQDERRLDHCNHPSIHHHDLPRKNKSVSFAPQIFSIMNPNTSTTPYSSHSPHADVIWNKSDYWYSASETKHFCQQTLDEAHAFQRHKLGHHGRYNRVLSRVYRICTNEALVVAMMGEDDDDENEDGSQHQKKNKDDSSSSILSEKDVRDLQSCMKSVGDERCGLETVSIPHLQRTVVERRRALQQRMQMLTKSSGKCAAISIEQQEEEIAHVLHLLTLPSVWYAQEIAAALAASIIDSEANRGE